MAHAAGADLADLELCQFHPTALAAPGADADGLLITEAVRGEGATLLDAKGERFTDELAPRDVVTLAILDRMELDGTDHVLLDLREIDPARFPNVFDALRAAGHDPATAPVPVSPASHYVMGGVATDLEGRTSLPGLFAVGECACTGLHGANRLASNSLTECFVLGAAAAAAAAAEPAATGSAPEPQRWRFVPPTPETRERRLAARRATAAPRGARAPGRGPVSAGSPDRGVRAGAGGVPRVAPPRRVPQHGPRSRRPAPRQACRRTPGMGDSGRDWPGVVYLKVLNSGLTLVSTSFIGACLNSAPAGYSRDAYL